MAYPRALLTGTFIGNQIGKYVNDLGFDGIYSTNGYGLQPAELPPYAGVYNTNQATLTGNFFQNLKQAMGEQQTACLGRYLTFPHQIDNTFLNMPTAVFSSIDYIQLSTFWAVG